ncbi:Na+/H+ antiporter family protein [Marinobacterium weihaiense]|uniref:TRAP transporter large permease subunit n=1 Tax=Marinobacterium weihaiense TaxID=2851016 RepID=A0ABS6M8K5_9GAMM|nr:Na+/H+ antiporter NhaC family protein [Marinobacterium weihaiense]MBV0932216.1 TRAP transporter large permease subunit [Marinobacterium weihaiense]
MNAVVVAVLVMLVLSLLRTPVVVALVLGALSAGLLAGMGLEGTLEAFSSGLGGGAGVALNYAMLGGFAVAIAQSGLPHAMADVVQRKLGTGEVQATRAVKYALIVVLVTVAISSQNLIPIHIAFIPLLVPPLLLVMSRMQLDRRLVACVLTFGLVTPYMFLPVGFGGIYLNDILLQNVADNGQSIEGINIMSAMWIPALGMLVGLILALFNYRKPRQYNVEKLQEAERVEVKYSPMRLAAVGVAVLVAFGVQLWTGSMVLGALSGYMICTLTGIVRWKQADGVLIDGMKMMAMIGFIMITAAGFAEVMRQTGEISTLVSSTAELIGDNKGLAALLMLVVGLLVTLGIGSSFSTIPIIAAIYVPLALSLGFSPLAIVALVGTAGALGDAGSPASDSTLGPTAGLNVDGQHHHIWDTVVPTFLHYNLPLLIAGWAAAMLL